MKLNEARELAEEVVEKMRPHCERIEIKGSICRRKEEVGDIEIVCIPSLVQVLGPPDLFGNAQSAIVRDTGFAAVVDAWPAVKGDAVAGKYFQRIVGGTGRKIKVDIFTAQIDNWGLIASIRTGSRAFSHNILAGGWVRRGYKSVEGFLRGRAGAGDIVPIREERDLFEIIGLAWRHPWERNL